jgi:uncharacterized protein (DUF1330 family)
MAAYFVAIRERTTDPEEFAKYVAVTPPPRPDNLTPRVINGRFAVLEGSPIEGVVILEFPTYEEAQAWFAWQTPSQKNMQRLKGARYQAFIVDGVP